MSMQCIDEKIFFAISICPQNSGSISKSISFPSPSIIILESRLECSSFYYNYFNPNWRYFSSYIQICLFSDSMFSRIDSHRITEVTLADEW